jgi:hypothetical protein
MAGRMGGKKVYARNLWIYMIDKKMNCIFVKGSVPGANGTVCKIEDSKRLRSYFINNPPPIPSFKKDSDENFDNLPFKETLIKAKFKRPAEWSGYDEKGDAIQESDEVIFEYVAKVRKVIQESGELPEEYQMLKSQKPQ